MAVGMGEEAEVRRVPAETAGAGHCTCASVHVTLWVRRTRAKLLFCTVLCLLVADAAPGPGSCPDFVCDPVLIQPWRV